MPCFFCYLVNYFMAFATTSAVAELSSPPSSITRTTSAKAFLGIRSCIFPRVNTFSPNNFSTFKVSLIVRILSAFFRPKQIPRLYFFRKRQPQNLFGMGRAVHFRSLFVLDPFHQSLHVPAVRFHNFNPVFHAELVSLLNPGPAFFIRFINDSQIDRIAVIGTGVINLGCLVGPAEIKSRGKLPVGAPCDFIQIPGHILPVLFFRLQTVVNGFPIGPCHRGHIQRRLHPPLDLKAVDPCFQQFGNVPDHAQILRVEQKSPSLVFVDRQILAGPGFLHHRIFPAAGMGAGPPVCVPPGKIVAQKASAGIGNAHGAVHEAFDFHFLWDLTTNPANLLQRQLPCRHNPLCAQVPPEVPGLVIGTVCLGGNMDLCLRPGPFGQSKHARVGNNQRVRRCIASVPGL